MAANPFTPPSWAAEMPDGWHLDVVKNGEVFEKLRIAGLPYVLFGRNEDVCDIPVAHPSASRVHAALLYHGVLDKPYIMDLGSAHGTFWDTRKLEPNHPLPLAMDATLRFGASTRTFTLRQKPGPDADPRTMAQYNAMMVAPVKRKRGPDDTLEIDEAPPKKASHTRTVRFNEQVTEHLLEPPGGRYADMVKSTIIVASTPKRAQPGAPRPRAKPPTTASAQARNPFATSLFRPRTVAGGKDDGSGKGGSVGAFGGLYGDTLPAQSNTSIDLPGEDGGAHGLVDVTVTASLKGEHSARKKYGKESWVNKTAHADGDEDNERIY